jgi:hypothetical protein
MLTSVFEVEGSFWQLMQIHGELIAQCVQRSAATTALPWIGYY